MRECMCVGGERLWKENVFKGRQMGNMTNGQGHVFSPSSLRQVLPLLSEGPPHSLCTSHTHCSSVSLLSAFLTDTHTHTQRKLLLLGAYSRSERRTAGTL